MENKLTSLVKHLRKHLERLKASPAPAVIKEAGNCLDLEDILEKATEVKVEKEKSLRKVMKKAKYGEEDVEKIVKQYDTFKKRFKDTVKAGGENEESEEIVKRFQHLIFMTHTCIPDCQNVVKKFPERGKVKVCPKNVMKFFHLFFKEPSLYSGLQDFLHLFLRYLVKTHAEGVVESMGNYVELHGDKRRGRMDISDIGREALIH